MSIGYNTILKLRNVEALANSMGFRFALSNHSGYTTSGYDTYKDVIALYPLDDKLPDYTRDAELFLGDLDEVATFLRGIQWGTNYLKMLKLVTNEKIERKEQDIRNKQLLTILTEVTAN